MSDGATDRNVLFGAFAMRMDFLTQEQWIEGMKSWVLNKSEPIENLLIAKQFLTQNQCDLLLPLVSHHIEQYGGDPARSLERLSSGSPSVTAIQQVDDDELKLSLTIQHLPATGTSDHIAMTGRPIPKTLETVAENGSISQRAGSRYLSIRPHAKGGLGEVFVAQDTELDREVALKEIQDRHADDGSSRARFVMEAEVTGKLEHPGIVPVYGLGSYEDGRPFYAMRFVRGDSLEETIKQFHQQCKDSKNGAGSAFETVAFRKLLGRFVDMCQAVGYAHSRGVLHRDLKPGNVMLGKHGETLVVDWGLAKLSGQADAAALLDDGTLQVSSGSQVTNTILGSAIGTPGYMSPEQAEGKLDHLGPATDIYGLGATFYVLLSGEKPISGRDLTDVLQRTAKGEFPKLREIQPQIPKPLEAICLKAMALSPVDRYVTCEAMAEDVESFLAGEAVSAYADPLLDRAKRWVRKHRTFATSCVAGIGVAVLGLVIGLVVVAGLNQQLDEQNAQLTIANEKEQAQRQLAERQTALAQTRLTQANEVANELLFIVDGKLKVIAPASDVRRELLDRTEQLLESLLIEAADDSNTNRLRGVQFVKRGEVALRYDDVARAKESHAAALNIFRKLAAADPANAEFHDDVAVSLSRLGDIAQIQGDHKQALTYYEEALSISRKLVAADPTNAECNRALSVNLERVGDMAHARGDVKQALAYYEEGLRISRELASSDPGNGEFQRDVSVTLDRLGNVAKTAGDVNQALVHYEEALSISRKLATTDHANANHQRDVSVKLERLGDIALIREDTKQALVYFDECLRIARQLAAADPGNAQYQRDVALSIDRLGDIAHIQGDINQAQAYFEECLNISRQLAAADSTNAQCQRDVALQLEKVGDIANVLEDLEHALASYEEALGIARRLTEVNPINATDNRIVSEILDRLGGMAQNQGDNKNALAYYQEALSITRKLIATDPDHAGTQRNLMVCNYKLGLLTEATNDWTAAAKHYAAGIAILDQMISRGQNAVRAKREREMLTERMKYVQGLENR